MNGRQLARTQLIAEQTHRRAGVGRHRFLDLPALLLHVHVERQPPAARFGVQRLDLDEAHGADAVGDHPQRLGRPLETAGETIDLLPVLPQVERREPRLGRLQRPADPARRVVRLQQDDPDADLRGRLQHDLVERVVPVAIVMEVVELAYGGDAGVAHLGEGLGTGPAELSAVERADQRVHRLAPAPEAAGSRAELFAGAAQPALEGMRVRVDEAREKGDAGQPPARHRAGRGDRFDPPVRSRW